MEAEIVWPLLSLARTFHLSLRAERGNLRYSLKTKQCKWIDTAASFGASINRSPDVSTLDA